MIPKNPASALLALLLQASALPAQEPPADLVVYGGTSAGVVAAVQARAMGLSVVLVRPEAVLGGLSASGLGATDSGDARAIGGLSREFYRRVRRHYETDAAWTRERRREFTPMDARSDALWRFEPHVAARVFEDWVRDAGVRVVAGELLDRDGGVRVSGARIRAIRLESGRVLPGRCFIDATYEGDLLAAAGVPYRVGREANARYGETLNGIQSGSAVFHQFRRAVAPWREPGKPESGLLPGILPALPGPDGSAHEGVQAYCFRLCLTDHPENRRPFSEPADYDPTAYELLLREYDAGATHVPWHSVAMPNRKTDTNNNHAVSTDYVGMSWSYPEADHATRRRIVAAHERWQRGLLWTLRSHPRVPRAVREEVSRWGLAADEFRETAGWPPLLYVREARRLLGDYVMTQHDCEGRRRAPDPVGLGAYTMDSHHVLRYVDARGRVRNEGDVQVPPEEPYPISYRALLPPRGSIANLAVTCCVGASHIAYGSIRMEPVFMILGQSAATACALALAGGERALQDVDYAALARRLEADGQVLAWRHGPRRPAGIPVADLPGIVVDDVAALLDGAWTRSTGGRPFVGRGYLHDGRLDPGEKSVRFVLPVPARGRYRVRIAYTAHPNRSSRTAVVVATTEGPRRHRVDQRASPAIEGLWHELGVFELAPDDAAVTVTNAGADGYVVADAVQALPVR